MYKCEEDGSEIRNKQNHYGWHLARHFCRQMLDIISYNKNRRDVK